MSAIGPGTLLLCINDNWMKRSRQGRKLPSCHPKAGHIYTVDSVEDRPWGPAVALQEVQRQLPGRKKCWWRLSFFKPLDEGQVQDQEETENSRRRVMETADD